VKHGYKRVGILAPNTPAFLEALFGIGAAGGVDVGMFFVSLLNLLR
jgi:acyl-CoA synthetase (AMP-forming)/AMP-acid ligase II